MKTKVSYLFYLAALFIFCFGKGYAQVVAVPAQQNAAGQGNAAQATPNASPAASNTPPSATFVSVKVTRPTDTLGIIKLDRFVTRCYDLYDKTNELWNKLNAIEQQIFNHPTDVEPKAMQIQLANFTTQLRNLKTIGTNLVTLGQQMVDDAPQSLKNKPLKIPGAVLRVKDAVRAVTASAQNVYTMLTVTLVDINHKLHGKAIPGTAPAANLSSNSAPSNNQDNSVNNNTATPRDLIGGTTAVKNVNGSKTVVAKLKSDTTASKANAAAKSAAAAKIRTGATMQTSISITGADSAAFRSFSRGLSKIVAVKSMRKKFSAAGPSEIDVVHYGSTDDLVSAMLINCRDVLSQKNIGKSENGKVNLVF